MAIIAQVSTLLGIVCSVIIGVSQWGGDFIMGTLSLLLYISFQCSNGTLSLSHENMLKQIPLTIESALSRFNLTSKTVPYAVCNCHCTYRPIYTPGSSTPSYPTYCTNHPTPEKECKEVLLNAPPNGQRWPKKTYTYHDFNDYLTNLLARRDIETLMDQPCDDLMESLSSPPPQFIKNPFDAQFLHTFNSPEPGKLFVD